MQHQLLGRQDYPYEAVMPAVAQHHTELVVGIALAIVFIWGAIKLVKHKEARLLICMITGFVCVLNESHARGMLNFVYPPVGQHVLYVGFSGPMPWFMGMEYWAYFDDQANMILDFPVHVAVLVSGISMVVGAATRLWFGYMKGAKQWLLILVGPALFVGVFSVYAFPACFGIESAGGVDSARIGSTITIIVSFTAAYYLTKLLSSIPQPRNG